MTKSKHTHGPWKLHANNVGEFEIYVEDKNEIRHRLASVNTIGGDCLGLPHAANARLIAAGPEMLAALKRLASCQPGDTLSQDDLDIIDEAIAKTEGCE